MVDAVVSFAVQKLGDFLIQRAVSRLRIKDNVEWLRNELRYMQSFLKDAEEKQTRDQLVQQWVSEITDLAYDTVTILENFITKVGSGEALKHGMVDRVKRCVCMCEKEANLYDIVNEIESLKQRVLDLSRKRETYGITSVSDAGEGSANSGPHNRSITRGLRRTTSYAEEEYFVGFEDVTKTLLKELLKEEDRRSVISIYGMGGLGKTTLARRLYNSVDIQNRFDCRGWVCVSQEYSLQALLRTTIKSFKRDCSKEEQEMIERMNEEDLERYLRQFLKMHTYLVVVDDVWRKEAWESLKRAFPDCNGSRVIITTRIKDVAERVDDRSFVHHLRFLRPKESWDLFKKKISSRDGHARWCTPAMQEMGKEMVGKCGGLPLAIVVIGGLLSNKKEPEEWHKVKEQLWQRMKQDSIDISHLLSLSYNDLSGVLKQCFLYVGIFPEDYVINAEKLMWLWMAEELIPQGNRMEYIAEDYLHELINRSLIQVASRFWGRIEECKIHDLLRDLAVQKAMDVNLFDIYGPCAQVGALSCRRHAIHTQINNFFSMGRSSAKLRSLVFFNLDDQHPKMKDLTIMCPKFKYLYILDLENVSFGSGGQRLPDVIGDLIHLRFLGLLKTNFEELPPTLGNLRNLQTLERSFWDSSPCRFPTEISKLVNLRHFYMHNSEGPLQVDSLINLRTLKGVRYDQWMDIDTRNLTNLRELVLMSMGPIGQTYSLDSVSNLNGLTSLTLLSYKTLPPLDPLFFCPNLLKLWLNGRLERLPPFNKFPPSLTMFRLVKTRLREDPMRILETLLNLRSLDLLHRAYNGKEITCSNNGFHQLEYLRLSGLMNLETWRLAETAMPAIISLTIGHCLALKSVPDRLESVLVPEEPEPHGNWNFYRQPYEISMSRMLINFC